MKESVEGCIDCDIAIGKQTPLGGIIYEDDYWIVNHGPLKILGHLIAKPRNHYEHIGDMDKEVMTDFGLVLKYICHAVMKVCKPEKVYVASFGEFERHVHFHIIPRYKGMPAHAAKVFQEFDNNKYTCTEEEVLSTVKEIGRELVRLVE